jgi:hypothetical protein
MNWMEIVEMNDEEGDKQLLLFIEKSRMSFLDAPGPKNKIIVF